MNSSHMNLEVIGLFSGYSLPLSVGSHPQNLSYQHINSLALDFQFDDTLESAFPRSLWADGV
jgi:hypothetical protein